MLQSRSVGDEVKVGTSITITIATNSKEIEKEPQEEIEGQE